MLVLGTYKPKSHNVPDLKITVKQKRFQTTFEIVKDDVITPKFVYMLVRRQ